MFFVAIASAIRPSIALHAVGCHMTHHSLTRQCVMWDVSAPTTAEALAMVRRDEETDERGLTLAACPCCYESENDETLCPCCLGRED